MKKRFSEEQITFALGQAKTDMSIQEVTSKMGISEQMAVVKLLKTTTLILVKKAQ